MLLHLQTRTRERILNLDILYILIFHFPRLQVSERDWLIVGKEIWTCVQTENNEAVDVTISDTIFSTSLKVIKGWKEISPKNPS